MPRNLDEIVNVQSAVNAQLLPLVGSTAVPASACSPTAAKYDWREHAKWLLPPNDQSPCGDCWAFAAVAAFEANWGIVNNQIIDVSDQEQLDCVPVASYGCNGGWHDEVFKQLVRLGAVRTADYGATATAAGHYEGRKMACRSPRQHYYFADTWGFVKGTVIPTDADMKEAICTHGPIVGAVLSQGWDLYSINRPEEWRKYRNGVFDVGQPNTPNLNAANATTKDYDHDVLIVGWDDAAGAWIIQNSWGPYWGDHGIMKLKYGTANIGFNAAWVKAASAAGGVTAAMSSPIRSEILRLSNPSLNIKGIIDGGQPTGR